MLGETITVALAASSTDSNSIVDSTTDRPVLRRGLPPLHFGQPFESASRR
jgi:hypothetical protein